MKKFPAVGSLFSERYNCFSLYFFNQFLPCQLPSSVEYGKSGEIFLNDCNMFKKMNNGRCFTSLHLMSRHLTKELVLHKESISWSIMITQLLNLIWMVQLPSFYMNLIRNLTLNISWEETFLLHRPGRLTNLKFSATIMDSTEDFDAMDFDSRKYWWWRNWLHYA